MNPDEILPPDDQIEMDSMSDDLEDGIRGWIDRFPGVDGGAFAACLFYHAISFSQEVLKWDDEEIFDIVNDVLDLRDVGKG